jgi:hypothetical protein
MVTAALADVPIEDGRRLISELDRAQVPIPAAFWLYSSEWDEWRLALASPVVDRYGAREMYRRVQRIMQALPGLRIRLDQLWAVGLKNNFVKALRAHVRADADLSGMRLTGNVFDGLIFEDMYVYRSTQDQLTRS